ncbi:MAG TPA: ABC transporter permease [Terriglobia bacterium]|nr:ABC transporter permease [Terriglobia bacterium]
MDWLRVSASRVRGLLARRRLDQDFQHELDAHLALLTEENIRRGLTPEEASRTARVRLGAVTQLREIHRELHGLPWLETLARDIRYALRMLRKNPGFTTVAVLTLALGIGANTAIFSVVDGVLLAPLPYEQPDRLVAIWESHPGAPRVWISYPNFQDWQRDARSFRQIVAFTSVGSDLTSPGTPEHLEGELVTAGFFSALGARLAVGREFSGQEDYHGGAPVVIISDRLWRNRFGARPDVLGKVVTLDGVDCTIVGVLPAGFHFESDPDVYQPLGQGDQLLLNNRAIHPGILAIGRLQPGVSVAQAAAEISSIQKSLDQLYPNDDRDVGTDVVPLKQNMIGNAGEMLVLLLGAVGLVLLIACANFASLLLARSAARVREFAVRLALGASRARIVWQLLTESVLLSVGGGGLGLLAGKWGVHPLLAVIPGDFPRRQEIGVNVSVLLFALGVSIAVGMLFGLAPALRSSRAELEISLRLGGRGATAHHRAQSGLVIAQVALTLVLLAGAGLLFRTIRRLWDVNPGFETRNLITFKIGLSPQLTGTPSGTRVASQQLMERIRQLPGVQAADFTNLIPLNRDDNDSPFWIGTHAAEYSQSAPRLNLYWTGPDYLQTMRIRLLRGRFLRAEDTVQSTPVIVVDKAFADEYFPGKNPLGEIVTIAYWGTAQIVGVVAHVRHWGLGDVSQWPKSEPVYASIYQIPDRWVPVFYGDLTAITRTPLPPASVMPVIKSAVYGADKGQPVYKVRTMQEIVSESMASQRFPMILLGAFAGLALLLASIGIYGVISYSVTQRAHEIGIRMALGAERRHVLRMTIGQGLRLALAGLALGVAAALFLARVLSSFSGLLYGVRPGDPVTFVLVSLVLTVVALLASYIPARRATEVDPMVALRYE